MSGIEESATDQGAGGRDDVAMSGVDGVDGVGGVSGAPRLMCVEHGDVAGRWHCGACGKVFCDECARVVASRDERYASCRACGERCDPLLDKYVDEDNRGGAVENAEQRRARIQTDWIVPAVILGVCGLFFLIGAAAGRGVVVGFVSGVIGLGVSCGALFGMLLLLGRWVGVEVEPYGSSVLKMGAIAAGVHLIRAVLWAMLAPFVSLEGGSNVAESMAGGLAVLLPTSMAFVIGPMLVMGFLVSKLLHVDSFERFVAIAFLFFAEAIAIAAMLAM